MERLDPIEQVEREPRPLQPETVTKILQAIPASNLRDRALFTLLYETGIRVGEALGMFALATATSQAESYYLWLRLSRRPPLWWQFSAAGV